MNMLKLMINDTMALKLILAAKIIAFSRSTTRWPRLSATRIHYRSYAGLKACTLWYRCTSARTAPALTCGIMSRQNIGWFSSTKYESSLQSRKKKRTWHKTARLLRHKCSCKKIGSLLFLRTPFLSSEKQRFGQLFVKQALKKFK